jgi:hypothetical protein
MKRVKIRDDWDPNCEGCGWPFDPGDSAWAHQELLFCSRACHKRWQERQDRLAGRATVAALEGRAHACQPGKYPAPTEPEPGLETLGDWVMDGVAQATDGCNVEPDGICEHGNPSWLRYLGLM